MKQIEFCFQTFKMISVLKFESDIPTAVTSSNGFKILPPWTGKKKGKGKQLCVFFPPPGFVCPSVSSVSLVSLGVVTAPFGFCAAVM